MSNSSLIPTMLTRRLSLSFKSPSHRKKKRMARPYQRESSQDHSRTSYGNYAEKHRWLLIMLILSKMIFGRDGLGSYLENRENSQSRRCEGQKNREQFMDEKI